MATWSKEQRRKAKSEKLALVQIAVDGRPLGSKLGVGELTAPVDEPTARKVLAFMEQLLCEHARRARRKKARTPTMSL